MLQATYEHKTSLSRLQRMPYCDLLHVGKVLERLSLLCTVGYA